MADVSLVQLTALGCTTYAAIHTADALELVTTVAATHGDDMLAAATVPWDTLPGTEAAVAETFETVARRSVIYLGTVVDGEWTAWHMPGPPPPVPLPRRRRTR